MSEELKRLVRSGFHKGNLERLSNYCEGMVATNPSLYGTLHMLFRLLESGLDSQATPTERIESIKLALEGPILDLIDAQQGPPSEFIQRLDEVLRNALAVL